MVDMTSDADLRTIDAEIARRVFSAEERPCHLAGHCDGEHWYYPDGLVEATLPRYSDEDGIAEAWLVIEKMRELGWEWEISVMTGDAEPYGVSVYRLPLEQGFGATVHAATAPLTICGAALSALSEDEQ